MKRKPRKPLIIQSFRFRITVIIAGLACLLIGALIFSNTYAIRIIRDRVYQMTRQNIHMQQRQIESDFSNVENYLARLNLSNPDIQILENPSNRLKWSLAVTRLQNELIKNLPTLNNIDGLFVYTHTSDLWFDAFRSGLPNHERLATRTHFINLLNEDMLFTDDRRGNWFPEKVNGRYIFFRVLQFRNTYVGAWVALDTLMEPLYQTRDDNLEKYFFSLQDGEPLDVSLSQENIILWPDDILHYYRYSGNANRYLMIADPSPFGPYYLVAMVRDNSILENLGNFGMMLLAILLIVILTLILLTFMMHRWMVVPLRQLTENLYALREGDFSVRVQSIRPYVEFYDVHSAFNEMITRIENLKINVYEEKLAKQANQLLYLQQQVKPHMFINCLNTIYSLAGTRRIDLLQKLCLDLSTHLRYTLSTPLLVHLHKEITHVKNYIEITSIRFPESLKCHISIPQSLQEAMVPPLLLQSLVENAIKHEVEIGKLLEIFIEADMTEDNRFEINVWDTGRGFRLDVLARLQTEIPEVDSQGGRIGLSNIVNRLRMLYDEGQAYIRFTNRLGAGAQIGIHLPFITEACTTNEEDLK